jgi:glycosyltransferase involved in cell wall biosynthesis
VVTYLGRISPEKNVHALVDAWQSLEATARTGWILRLVGFPPKGQSRFADKLARRCESIPDIKVEPFCGLERKWDILLESDVVVLPSLTENFGIVVAEALACGIPVVATKGTPWEELLGNSASALVHYCESSLVENEQKSESGSQKSGVSDTHELARTGRAGWWVDISAEALAEALRQALILTDAERLKLGENGKALVSKKYRWPVIAAEMERVYEWAEGSGTQPSCVRHS